MKHPSRFTGTAQLLNENGEVVDSVQCSHAHGYYKAIFSAMRIAYAKNNDYTGGNDQHPLANFKESEQSGIDAKQGLWLRMLDKIGRIKTFFKTGKLQVVGESERDAFSDLGNYAFLMLALLEEDEFTHQPKPTTSTFYSTAHHPLTLEQQRIVITVLECAQRLARETGTSADFVELGMKEAKALPPKQAYMCGLEITYTDDDTLIRVGANKKDTRRNPWMLTPQA